jgi:hypothetical protein
MAFKWKPGTTAKRKQQRHSVAPAAMKSSPMQAQSHVACPECGISFSPRSGTQTYCSIKCRRRANEHRTKQREMGPREQDMLFRVNPLLTDPNPDPEEYARFIDHVHKQMDGPNGETSYEAIVGGLQERTRQQQRVYVEPTPEQVQAQLDWERNPFNEDQYLNVKSQLFLAQLSRRQDWLRDHPEEPLYNPTNPLHPQQLAKVE